MTILLVLLTTTTTTTTGMCSRVLSILSCVMCVSACECVITKIVSDYVSRSIRMREKQKEKSAAICINMGQLQATRFGTGGKQKKIETIERRRNRLSYSIEVHPKLSSMSTKRNNDDRRNNESIVGNFYFVPHTEDPSHYSA